MTNIKYKRYDKEADLPSSSTQDGDLFFTRDTKSWWVYDATAGHLVKASASLVWGAITGTLSNQTDLQTALTNESTARSSGDSTNATAIAAETSRATTAEAACEKTANKDQANGYAGLDSGGKLKTAEAPTWNQNTSGTAANLSGTPALPNGTTGTTQAAADNSTKLATTAYADAAAKARPVITKTASYAVQVSDGGSTIIFNVASVAVATLPAVAPGSGWYVRLLVYGGGTLVINPNGLTLDGSTSSQTIPTSAGNAVFSDGSNYALDCGSVGLGAINQLAVYSVQNGVTGSSAIPNGTTATTQAVDDNSTKPATTAYVTGQLSASGDGTPAMDGTASRGSSTHAARADHVHPTDTSRQASLTGTGLARQSGACTELSGDVTTSGSNATTLKNTGTAGTYTKVTTDAQGRVSSGTTLTWPDLPTSGVAPGTGIAYKRSVAGNPTSDGNGGITLTIQIDQGDTVVVFVNYATSYNGGETVGDDAGNPYSLAVKDHNGSGWGFCIVAINCPRAATFVRIGTAGGVGLISAVVATYSGVKSAKTYTSTNGSASTNATVSLTTTVANSFMVAGFNWFKSGTGITISPNVGNFRVGNGSSATATVTGCALIDNTTATPGSLTCSGTLSTTPTGYGATAIELVPA